MTSIVRRLWASPHLLLTLTIAFWAGNSIIGRAMRDSIPPATFAAFRWTGASLLLMPFAWVQFRRDVPALLRAWRIVLAIGFLGVGMFNTLVYLALHYTTATNALLIQGATAPMILLVGWAVFRDRVGLEKLAATFLSIGGVAAVVSQGRPAALLHLHLGLGDALVFAATLCWAFYTVLLRRKPDVAPISLLAATFLIGVSLTAPLALWETAQGARILWSPATFAAIAYVAVLPSLIAYVFYNRAVEIGGGALAGQFMNAMPVVGALMAALLLGEALAWYHLLGMGMIVTALFWFSRSR